MIWNPCYYQENIATPVIDIWKQRNTGKNYMSIDTLRQPKIMHGRWSRVMSCKQRMEIQKRLAQVTGSMKGLTKVDKTFENSFCSATLSPYIKDVGIAFHYIFDRLKNFLIIFWFFPCYFPMIHSIYESLVSMKVEIAIFFFFNCFQLSKQHKLWLHLNLDSAQKNTHIFIIF